MSNSLLIHVKQWSQCKNCDLHKGRQNVVLYRGRIPSTIVFIGEAPGRSEDLLGEPFIGPAGRILDALIAAAGVRLLPYSITNTVACIPTTEQGNLRLPSKQERESCRNRLLDFLQIASPTAIVLLGKVAQGSVPSPFHSHPSCSLKHPAYLLRRGGIKSPEFRAAVNTLRTFSHEIRNSTKKKR